MRECHRILCEGGRLAAIAIEPARGLGPAARDRAVEIGPSHLGPDDSIEESAVSAGFRLLEVLDLTADFRRVAVESAGELQRRSAELRSEEDEQTYVDELDRKTRMVRGVDEGLLVRTLVLAERR